MLQIIYVLVCLAARSQSLNESNILPLRLYPSNGVWRYENLAVNHEHFVDKSLLIKDFLDTEQVVVVSRPQRWGKTLNMDMLTTFLQVELDTNSKPVIENSNRILFEGGCLFTENITRCLKQSKIAQQHPDIMEKYFGKHYVIKLNFHLGYGTDYAALNREYGIEIRKLFYQCKFLFQYYENSYLLKKGCDKKNLRKFISSDIGTLEASKGFTLLLDCISAHFDTTVYVFIDEYHHPSESAYSVLLEEGPAKNESYVQFCKYMGSIYKGIYKDTKNVRGLITGTSVAPMRELSKYSDLSFIKEDSLLNPVFTEHYGFTEEEVDLLISNSSMKAKSKDIKHHYKGYTVAGVTIYNVISIIECLGYNKVGPYWAKVVGSIEEFIPNEIKNEVSTLMYSNANVTVKMPQEIPHLMNFKENEPKENAYFRALILGLFTAVRVSDDYYNFSIPNYEARNYMYQHVISHWLDQEMGAKEFTYWKWDSKLAAKLINHELEFFEKEISYDLHRFLVPRNATDDKILGKFYDDFMTLLLFPVSCEYIMRREYPSDDKRVDLLIIPDNSAGNKQNATIIGYGLAESNETISSTSSSILTRVQSSNNYQHFQRNTRIKQIQCIGVAFYKNLAKVDYRIDPNPNYQPC